MYLPSNSNDSYHPDNTISHYSIRLHKPLELEGSWQVALVECTVPSLWKNIDHKRCRLSINTDGESWSDLNVARGFYEDNYKFITAVSTAIQQAVPADTSRILHYDSRERRALFDLPENVSIKLYGGIAQVLGYKTAKLLHGPKRTRPPATVDVNHGTYLLYIYLNIVEPQRVGNAEVNLIRTVYFNAYDSERRPEVVYSRFNSPHYINVNKKYIDTLTVDIRDPTGERIPFLVGSSSVKLHFRQTKPNFG